MTRTERTLASLFNQLLEAYQAIYESKYDEKYDEPNTVRDAVQQVTGGEGVSLPKWCPYIHKHYHSREITPVLWSSCEWGEGVDACPPYRRETRKG